MVSLKINFGKKDFVWIGLLVVLVGVGFGYALNSGDYTIMGHSADELAPPIGCLPNQALIWNGGAWACGTPAGGTASVVLGSFGTSESKSKDTTYTATTDGVVVVGSSGESSGTYIYSGTTTSNMVVVARENSHGAVSITFPIKSGNSWKVTGSVGYVHWIPIDSSAIPTGGTPGNCVWQPVTWNTNEFCPSGKVVQGIDTCPRDGHRDICSLYCCDII